MPSIPRVLRASRACPMDTTACSPAFAHRDALASIPSRSTACCCGFNEDQIIPFGMFAREEGVVVRFIEFMPLEEDRVWKPEVVVTLDEILARMSEYRPLTEIEHGRSETARRYRFDDGIGEFGIIAPVSHPFCGHCSRIRITSDGKLRTCLFSTWDHDLHELMRRGAPDEKLAEFIVKTVESKEERHHIGEPGFVPASRTMVHIGG